MKSFRFPSVYVSLLISALRANANEIDLKDKMGITKVDAGGLFLYSIKSQSMEISINIFFFFLKFWHSLSRFFLEYKNDAEKYNGFSTLCKSDFVILHWLFIIFELSFIGRGNLI